MPYKHTWTQCVVRLIPLRGLSPAPLAQCQSLRAEAGSPWTHLVTVLTQSRTEERWLDVEELEQATKGRRYALRRQSVQALCEKRAANVETATERRRREVADTGHLQIAYPHHPKAYQTVIWKDQACRSSPWRGTSALGAGASGREGQRHHLLEGDTWRLEQDPGQHRRVSPSHRRSAPDTSLTR
jgi:hypothetical protein